MDPGTMITTQPLAAVNAVKERQELLEGLYKKAFPAVARFVSQRNGNLGDARDIFQDALIIFYEKLVAGKITVGTTDEAYLLGITRHLWFRKFRQEQGLIPLEDAGVTSVPDDFFAYKEPDNLLSFLERTGKKCMQLLRAFYYDKRSLQSIKDEFGYGTIRSATVQKFKCLEKMREEVKEKNKLYEDFTG
jgi:DNA-directed RNA polymerase specialized sigma24 family protein